MSSETISITKAFGIILMVVGHAGCPDVLHYFIYMFHMPLFFIMSGYCFKDKYITAPKQFVLRRIKGLYVPYVAYSLLFLLFHNVLFHLNIYNGQYGFNGKVSHLYSLAEFVRRGINIITAMFGHDQLLGGFWFIKALFFGSLVAFLAIKYIRQPIVGAALMLVITAVSCLFPIIYIPYIGINNTIFMAAMFVMVGRVLKTINIQFKVAWIVLVAVCVFVVSLFMPCAVPIAQPNYPAWKVLPFCICATMGTLMTAGVSSYIAKGNGRAKQFLVWIGNNTLSILTWHFISFKLVSLLIIYIYNLPEEQLACFPVIYEYSHLWWIPYSIIGVAVPLLITYICMRLYVRSNKRTNL